MRTRRALQALDDDEMIPTVAGREELFWQLLYYRRGLAQLKPTTCSLHQHVDALPRFSYHPGPVIPFVIVAPGGQP